MRAERAEASAVAAQNELMEVTKRWVDGGVDLLGVSVAGEVEGGCGCVGGTGRQ